MEGKDQKISNLLESMQEMEERVVSLEDQQAEQKKVDTDVKQSNQEGVQSPPSSKEIESLKAALAEKDKLIENKELTIKKAIATAKKLKFQLGQTNKGLEETKAELVEVVATKESLEARLASSPDIAKRSEEQETTQQPVEVEEICESVHTTTTYLSRQPSSSDGGGKEEESLNVDNLQSQVVTYREMCEQLQQKVQTLTNSVFENESSLKQKQNEIDQLEGVKEGLKLTVNEVEKLYQNLQAEFDKKEEECIASQREFEKDREILTEQTEQWKSFLENVQHENSSKDEQLQCLTAQLQTLSQEKSDLNLMSQRLEEKDENLMNLMSELEAIQAAQMQEDQQMKELKHQLRVAAETIEELKIAAEENQAMTLQSSSMISSLQVEVEAKIKQNADLFDLMKQQKSDFEMQEQGFQSQLSGMDKQVEDYKNRIVELTSVLDSAQHEKDEALVESNSLKEKLDSQDKDLKEMKCVVENLNSDVQEVKRKSDEERAEEVNTLNSSLQECQQQIEEQKHMISLLKQNQNRDPESEKNEVSPESIYLEVEDLKLQLANYQDVVEELNLEILALKTAQPSSVSENDSNNLSSVEDQLDEVLQEKEALVTERNQLQQSLDEQLAIAKKMEAIVTEKLDHVEKIQTSYENLQSVVQALTSEKEQLLADAESLRGELEGMQQVLVDAHLAHTETKENLRAANKERDKAVAEASSLQSELAKEKMELAALKFATTDDNTSRSNVSPRNESWQAAVVEERPVVFEECFQQASAPSLSAATVKKDSSDSDSLREVSNKLKQVQTDYDKTKVQLQVSEVKCEKMLVKLKNFKDKNDKLQIEVSQIRYSNYVIFLFWFAFVLL